MDPNATMAIVRDASADNYDRDIAAADLNWWLSHGGFPPDGYSIAATFDVLATFRRTV